MQNKLSLWINSKKKQYFLIPDNQKLPKGNDVIRRLMGIEQQIDLAAIAPYEISAKEAEPYMQQEVTQAMEEISRPARQK
jgi:hypothetical protein